MSGCEFINARLESRSQATWNAPLAPCALTVGETPSRSANPATLLCNLLIAIEPRHFLPAALGEGFGQRAFRRLVTASGAWKDRNRRNPVRQIIPGPALDAKHRAGLRHSLQRLRTKALVRRHRQDQGARTRHGIRAGLCPAGG